MGKKKNAPVASAAAAESKAIENLKTLNAKLLKETQDQRKQMEQLQLQLVLASLKNNAPASAAAGRIKVMDNMKTLNTKLVKEVEELRKQTEQLRYQIASFNADRNILGGIEREVLGLVLFSTIGEAAASKTAEMAATNSELDVTEMRLLALIREKDAVGRDLERRVEQRDSCVRSWRKQRVEEEDGKSGFIPLLLLLLSALLRLFLLGASAARARDFRINCGI